MSNAKRSDRLVLGWLTLGRRLVTAVLSVLVFSSSAAWALDFDRALASQSADASQIVKTLGRGKKPNSQEARFKKKKKVYVQLMLIKRHSRKM